jgi:hypothetical protein
MTNTPAPTTEVVEAAPRVVGYVIVVAAAALAVGLIVRMIGSRLPNPAADPPPLDVPDVPDDEEDGDDE